MMYGVYEQHFYERRYRFLKNNYFKNPIDVILFSILPP